MPVTVNINNLSLVHTQSTGYSAATLPDVCKTPPTATPVPYPNVAFSSDLAKGTTTVFADGGNMCANHGSELEKSTGDEPGSIGGVKSGVVAKEATWMTFSMDVKLEGKGACRLTDKMFHNRGNTVNAGGETQPDLPRAKKLLDRLLWCPEAQTLYEKAVAANGGKEPDIVMKEGGGSVRVATGTIDIDPTTNKCEQLRTLCFELGNLSQKATVDAIWDNFNVYDEKQFIRAAERVEHQSGLEMVKVIKACSKRWWCPEPATVSPDFETYFRNVNEEHKERLGTAWRALKGLFKPGG